MTLRLPNDIGQLTPAVGAMSLSPTSRTAPAPATLGSPERVRNGDGINGRAKPVCPDAPIAKRWAERPAVFTSKRCLFPDLHRAV